MKNKIENFRFNHVEDTGWDDVYLMNTDDESIVVLISKDEVFEMTSSKEVISGMVRSGWDDYREVYSRITPEDRWEEESAEMVDEAWNKITRTYMDADENILKIEEPC